MAIEPRKPPPQFVAKLQRALGGSAGWGGFVVQILFVAVVAWIVGLVTVLVRHCTA